MQGASHVICGAGITGLTLARELLRRGADSILILDKEEGLGRHASGRNSGVLHAGIYYAPDSTRARTCLAGNLRMKQYCRENGLPLLETGKVIVARDPSQLSTLHELHRRATANGADVRLIDDKELAEIEPEAKSVGQAIHSPLTAVVDPKAVLERLRRELTESGRVRFLLGAAFLDRDGDNAVKTTKGRVEYEFFINAAGSHADTVARTFALAKEYVLIPFKGIYKKLRKPFADSIRGSIYPVPDIKNPFLGVHFTRGIAGDVYLGPTAIPALGRENYKLLEDLGQETFRILAWDVRLFFTNPKFRQVALTEPRKYFFKNFFEDARSLVKRLDPEDVLPSPKAGIRPQLIDARTGELVMDFVVQRTEKSLHVLNAISPAFTSSLAFCETLADAVEGK